MLGKYTSQSHGLLITVSMVARPSRVCRSPGDRSATAFMSAGLVKLVASCVEMLASGWPAFTSVWPGCRRNFT
ncbi:hypothetical protein D3C85_1721040 [compost metagenome]